jgi:ketosteroid isomerase-like protein
MSDVDDRLQDLGSGLRSILVGLLGLTTGSSVGRGLTVQQRASFMAEVTKFYQDLQQATNTKDATFFQDNVSDDYLMVVPPGYTVDKTEMVADIFNGDLAIQEFNRRIVATKFHYHAGYTCTVVSDFKMKGTYQGKIFSGDYRDTHTLIHTGSGWQLAATHVVRIPGTEPAISPSGPVSVPGAAPEDWGQTDAT